MSPLTSFGMGKPPATAAARLVRKQAKAFTASLSGALRTGGVRAVHDLRVASRRLGEALRAAPGSLRSGAEKLRRRLRKIRRAFRRVRDLDVMLELIASSRPADPAAAAAESRASQILRGERKAAVSRAVKDAEGSVGRTTGRLRRAVAGFEPTRAGIDRLVDNRTAAMKESLSGWSAGKADPHAVRIAGKRLRYALELHAAVERPHTAAIAALRKLQEALGEWHDGLVLAQELERLGVSSAAAAGRRRRAAARRLNRARACRRQVQEALHVDGNGSGEGNDEPRRKTGRARRRKRPRAGADA